MEGKGMRERKSKIYKYNFTKASFWKKNKNERASDHI